MLTGLEVVDGLVGALALVVIGYHGGDVAAGGAVAGGGGHGGHLAGIVKGLGFIRSCGVDGRWIGSICICMVDVEAAHVCLGAVGSSGAM